MAENTTLTSLKEMFPLVSENRLLEVSAQHVEEELPDPLAATIDFFLSNPTEEPLSQQQPPGSPIPVVDLSGDQWDVEVYIPAPHSRANTGLGLQAGATPPAAAPAGIRHGSLLDAASPLVTGRHDAGPALVSSTPTSAGLGIIGHRSHLPQQLPGRLDSTNAFAPRPFASLLRPTAAVAGSQAGGLLASTGSRAGAWPSNLPATSASSSSSSSSHCPPPAMASLSPGVSHTLAWVLGGDGPPPPPPRRLDLWTEMPPSRLDTGMHVADLLQETRRTDQTPLPAPSTGESAFTGARTLPPPPPLHPSARFVSLAMPAAVPPPQPPPLLPTSVPTLPPPPQQYLPSASTPLGPALPITVGDDTGMDEEDPAMGDNNRLQPVASQSKPAFFMHEVKSTVTAMFPEIEEEYLETLIKKQPDDHTNRVCNYLLENSGFPKKKKKVPLTPPTPVSRQKDMYMDSSKILQWNVATAVHRLLLFEFPQVAAADIKDLCRRFKNHYTPTRRHIEMCLKESSTVAYGEQIVNGDKLKTASASTASVGPSAGPSLSRLQESIGALASATDQLVWEAVKYEASKVVTAPPPNLAIRHYLAYQRSCSKVIRQLMANLKRPIDARSINVIATQMRTAAMNGEKKADPSLDTTTKSDAKSDTADTKPKLDLLCLLKCPRKLKRPQGLPLELEDEARFYDEHLKLDLQPQPSSTDLLVDDDDDLFECGCCFGEVPFHQLVQCSEGHLFCEDCLRAYVKEAVYGQGKSRLSCMTDGCDSRFQKNQLQKALPGDVLAKYEERVQEESLALAQMPGLVECPFCGFKALMAPDDKVFVCANETCLRESCRYCKEDWKDHFGIPCSEIEQKDDTKFRKTVEELMTKAKVRKCSRCATEFFKEDGCNKMTCRCGLTMCYVCRKEKISYQHFCQHVRDPGKGCQKCNACSLWANAKEDDAQAVDEVREELKKQRKVDTGEEFDRLIGPPPDNPEPPAKKKKMKP